MDMQEHFDAIRAHTAELVKQVKADRAALIHTRALLSHCVVELMLRDVKGFAFESDQEKERARLFALWDAGKIRLSIGGGKVAFEMDASDA